jgi:hypothetical protein
VGCNGVMQGKDFSVHSATLTDKKRGKILGFEVLKRGKPQKLPKQRSGPSRDREVREREEGEKIIKIKNKNKNSTGVLVTNCFINTT